MNAPRSTFFLFGYWDAGRLEHIGHNRGGRDANHVLTAEPQAAFKSTLGYYAASGRRSPAWIATGQATALRGWAKLFHLHISWRSTPECELMATKSRTGSQSTSSINSVYSRNRPRPNWSII